MDNDLLSNDKGLSNNDSSCNSDLSYDFSDDFMRSDDVSVNSNSCFVASGNVEFDLQD